MTNRVFQPNCPLPKFDFDVITLAHGSGGLLTHRLLEEGVFKLLKNEFLDEQHDGAILHLPGKVAFTTDSFVISPIFFPGGNIGKLAVYGTVNDLAMCGAIPQYLSLSFIIEEGLRVEDLWKIIEGVRCAAIQSGVQIVTGDTKVVEKGKGDQIFINTTGIGTLHPKANILIGRIQPGDKIIINGEIATHGMAVMSVREGLEFETDIQSDSTNLNEWVKTLLDELGENIHFLRDPTRGGVATTLNEIAQKSNLGISLIQSQIPIGAQVEGACEMLGLDPLYVANEGKFLAIVSPSAADKTLEILKKNPQGKNAAIIGEVIEDHPGQVVLKSTIGGRRVLGMLPGGQLPRIC
ncbi:MAG: hydrogenase expression/formation protein HypE [Bacteroidia bacterium]|nr:hydrogenase expression/formation protein HypE [Bacteroidia bacterium]